MKDLYSKLGVVQVLAPVVLAATDTGAALDLQGFNSAAFVINTGAIVAAGDFATEIQESDTTTSGDFTAVAAANLQGTLPATLAAATAYKVGYIGAKRYVRAVTTKTGGTSIAIGIALIKGHAENAPVA